MEGHMAEKTVIMIVDDEPDILKIMDISLKLADLECLKASTGEECLEMLGKGRIPDLLLLDIMMPGMSGYDVCKRIKNDEKLKGIKIIMLTAKGQKGDAEEGLKAGADDYIIKPFDPYELIEQIKEILSR